MMSESRGSSDNGSVIVGAMCAMLMSSISFRFSFFLEYAGKLRIIVLKGEEESYINSHTDTLKTHTETHTSTHAQGKQKNTGPPPVQRHN